MASSSSLGINNQTQYSGFQGGSLAATPAIPTSPYSRDVHDILCAMEVYVMFSLCMMWLLAGGTIVVASVLVAMSAAKLARIAQLHCLLSDCLFYLLSTPFNRYCCLASNSRNAESMFQPKLFAMSTNNRCTDVSANSTQVQKPASTRYSPLLHNGDSFRLLRVLPSLRHGSPIRCEIFTSSISR